MTGHGKRQRDMVQQEHKAMEFLLTRHCRVERGSRLQQQRRRRPAAGACPSCSPPPHWFPAAACAADHRRHIKSAPIARASCSVQRTNQNVAIIIINGICIVPFIYTQQTTLASTTLASSSSMCSWAQTAHQVSSHCKGHAQCSANQPKCGNKKDLPSITHPLWDRQLDKWFLTQTAR